MTGSKPAKKARVAAYACAVLALAISACAQATGAGAPPGVDAGSTIAGAGVRVLSWNVSSDAFVRDPLAFRALVRRSGADILLLDEVTPAASASQIRAALAGLKPEAEDHWYVDFGSSGGRQRGVIVSRMPLERLPEFSDTVPYPESERARIHDGMVAADELRPAYDMDGGIPVNGVVVAAGARRLLVVTTDFQCCGGDPRSWQEQRRRVEARELRRRVRLVLGRTPIDGIILAGDLNLVSTPLPMLILSGPYPPPHGGLIAAELRHLDGSETWTIDNQGTPYAPRALDFVLYSPHSLGLREGHVLDTEDLSPLELEELGLQPESAAMLSDHRPLVAEFVWH